MRITSCYILLAVSLVGLVGCESTVSPKFREPQALSLSESKEDRLDFGCTLQVYRTFVDEVEITRENEDGSVDESMEILPVVDESKPITIILKPFGKFTGTVMETPEFVTMAVAGSDDDGNPILNFSADESFIYVGKVTDKRGKVSQCSIGVTVIEKPEEEE